MNANYVSELLYLTNSNSSSCWFDRCSDCGCDNDCRRDCSCDSERGCYDYCNCDSERGCDDYCNCDSECYHDNGWDRCSCDALD